MGPILPRPPASIGGSTGTSTAPVPKLPRRPLFHLNTTALAGNGLTAGNDAPQEALGGICEIVVLGQPTALNTVETVNAFDRPMATGFPCLGGMQHGELTFCRSVHDVDFRFLLICH
jgi:hypothetical protein